MISPTNSPGVVPPPRPHFDSPIFFIGASLSKPHTRELGGEISVILYVCLLACLYPSDFARELEAKCSRGMSEQLLTPSQQVTGSILGNDMLFFSFCTSAMYTHAHQLPVQFACMQHIV